MTRHNIGFMVVAELARQAGAEKSRRRFRAELTEAFVNGQKLLLAQPQTYMNLSGHAVREILNWYHAPLDDLLVVFDDLDLPAGQMRMRARGSSGGHNGLASIIEQLGTDAVPRLRVGIGRGRGASTSRVLSRFTSEEERALPDLVNRAVDAVRLWSAQGIVTAMNAVNRRDPPGPAVESCPDPTL